MAAIFGQIDFADNLKVNLFRKGAKKIYVNDSLLKKQTEIQNYIRSVCFCSNDIYIVKSCLLYTSPSPRDGLLSRMPSSA